MQADHPYSTGRRFANHLRTLKVRRYAEVAQRRKEGGRRQALSKTERQDLLRKTGRRCHICGGRIKGDDWQADHVLAHSTGGGHAVDNFLPAHTICNNYRWHYGSEEFQWIIKLGVWLRSQIEEGKSIGPEAAERFCDYDRRRAARRR